MTDLLTILSDQTRQAIRGESLQQQTSLETHSRSIPHVLPCPPPPPPPPPFNSEQTIMPLAALEPKVGAPCCAGAQHRCPLEGGRSPTRREGGRKGSGFWHDAMV